MKTKIKLLARLFLVTLLFSFIGCSEDVYENHVHNKPIPLKNNISFEQFKRETGLTKFDTNIKINQNDDTVLNRNADGSYELSDFNIATDVIKRVDFNEKTTYTFQIKPVVEVANGHFYNLTMFYKEGWQSIITKLIPSVENAIELQQGTEEKFEGTMSKLYQSNLPPNSIESCITIFVISTHCTGTGDCASGTCDGCDQCYSSDSYRLCSDTPAPTLYINAGPSTGGSYSGGVGGPPNGATEPPFNNDIVIDPNLTDRSVFEDPNYINQFNTGDFYYNLDDNQQQWANNNLDTYNQLIQYQIDNNWSDESEQFALQLLDEIRNSSYNAMLIEDPNIILIEADESNRVLDINEYLECFNLSQGATFTIYVDQPTANSNEPWSGNISNPDVGHTFISIKQGNIRRVIGLYPSSAVSLNNPSVAGAFYNDSHHEFDVALSFNINSTNLNDLVNYITGQSNGQYNLNTNNCTDFGIASTRIAGVNLPPAYGTWGIGSIGGAGDNPGQLGQNIRNMPTPSGAVKTTASGVALSNIGTCN